MTVTWLGGNRVLGLSSERDSSQLFNPTGVGGWVELGRTTLGSASSTIDVSGFASKRYLMLLVDGTPVGSVYHQGRFNNDDGFNYANRRSWNGNSDAPIGGRSLLFEGGNSTTTRHFDVHYIANYATKEKLTIGHTVYEGGVGASVAPHREEFFSKWINNSVPITRYTEVPQLGNLASGAEVVVLGFDPVDTHTTNFWEELASVEWTSGGTINSGTFTAKKYLWVQGWWKGNSGVYIRANSDSGANYSRRYNNNGGADGTGVSESGFIDNFGFDANPCFFNQFIINNSANEKLSIMHIVNQSTVGAGTAPNRVEVVSKWTNTSSQITSLQLVSSVFTGGQIKVWGSN